MSYYRAVSKSITLDGTGAFTGDLSLLGGSARLVSTYYKYTATGAGTSVTLTDTVSGKALGAAVVGNTNVETQLANEVVSGLIHVVISGGTAAGVVLITFYLDVG